MNEELKMIKKKYGEKMAHFCRDYLATILETDGLLLKLLLDNFEPSHDLYEDIVKQNKEDEFKNYIYSLVDVKNNYKERVIKTPKELLEEVDYDLYECKCEEDIQKFKKYYAKGEELCTFNGGRLDRCYVFFAVKKNVDNIKREDFSHPERQDEYGTSVISIQFTKDKSHTLSIKNRYNHHVNNPDSTFSNNLDNIIEGLTESFAKHYGLVQSHLNNGFELRDYVQASDGKLYKYNQEINNIYYCPNNIIIDNYEVKKFEKEKNIVFDYFILDLVKKEVRLYDQDIIESFPDTIPDIQKIEIKRKEEEEKEIKITLQDNGEVIIVLDKNNELKELSNQHVKKIGNNFLFFNRKLIKLNLPNLEEVGNIFLDYSPDLKKIDLPKLKKVGDLFISSNVLLQEINLPSLEEVGNHFLLWARLIKEVNLPSLEKVGNNFMNCDTNLESFLAPHLREVGNNFLYENTKLTELDLPNLQTVENYFLGENKHIHYLNLPKLQRVGDGFLSRNISLIKLDLPLLKKVRNSFFAYNKIIQEVNLPSLVTVGNYFLDNASCLKEIYLSSLEEVGDAFLSHNTTLEELDLPSLKVVGNFFFLNNKVLKKVNLPSLEKIGGYFFCFHPSFSAYSINQIKKESRR